MTDMHIRVGGVWKQVNRMYVRVSGVWKEVFRGYVRVSGVWKEFFGGFVTVTNITLSHTNAGTPTAQSVRFNRDGSIDDGTGSNSSTMSYAQTHAGEWWSAEPNATIGDNFEVRCASVTTGSPDLLWIQEAAAIGTYIGLTAGREWLLNAQGGKIGPNTKSITVSSFQIRLNGGAVQDTFNVSLTAIRT